MGDTEVLLCAAIQPLTPPGLRPFACSLNMGHAGPHVAVLDDQVLAEWPRPSHILRLDGTLVEVATSLWCDTCSLPSAYSLHVVVTPTTNPLHVMARLCITRCDGCGTRYATPHSTSTP